MSTMDDFNTQIIDEFRANAGVVGGPFAGANMVLVHHRGAKSGVERVTPLVYRTEGESIVVFASKGGAPTNPDWFHNLVANPETTIEIGTQTRSARARVAEGDERTRIWDAQKVESPQFAEYEAKTDRLIPVVVLETV
jgi:deazaflavin-dependent oxidoreductase (nitroreductase family)